MSDLAPRLDDDEAIAATRLGEAAAKLAQRLCHDFMSPASGIISGLDLLEDPSAAALHDEARELIASSARKLVESITFARAAFGTSGESFATSDLEDLARAHFAHLRPDLEWAVEAGTLPAVIGRTLLHFAQFAGGALAAGGRARASVKLGTPWSAILVEAIGERARLHPEIAAGLKGEPIGQGLSGRWIQAFLVHELVRSAGGAAAVEVADGSVTFKAALPG